MKQQTLTPMKLRTFARRPNEYWRHVSPQEELPIAGGIKSPSEFKFLHKLLDEMKSGIEETKQKELIRKKLMEFPSLIHLLRLLIGISNKRAYLDLSWEFREAAHPERETSLCGCPKTDFTAHSLSFFENMLKRKRNSHAVCDRSSELITDYFFNKGLGDVLSIFANISSQKRDALLEKTVFPREIQQSEAKRRGHGAEAEFAKIVEQLGCKILPEGKSKNPMIKDLRLNVKDFAVSNKASGETRSYDMAICDKNNMIRGCVIAMVHSSDPGEYGVAKAERVEQYKKEIEQYNKTKTEIDSISLWALVDGTGFSENKKDTIDRILSSVDFFVQMKTLFKIGLHLHMLGLCSVKGLWVDSSFYQKQEIRNLLEKYKPNNVLYLENQKDIQDNWKPISAGVGVLYI